MMPAREPKNAIPLISLNIGEETDIVMARQRSRQIAAAAGFSQQDQVRLATAVSEVGRNAFQYAGGGRVEFFLELEGKPQILWIHVVDHGPGIRDISGVMAGAYESPTGMGMGLSGTRRLMDYFTIESKIGRGTTVRFGKALPPAAEPIDRSSIANITAILSQQPATGAYEEIRRQNQDLLSTLSAMRERELELERRHKDLARLNTELEDTNRGVVALYAELDEKATALRVADELKSKFLSHVSHEFRTPVNSILALAQLLLKRADGELTAEQEIQVNYIRRSAQDLIEMVNDLLDLAKVEAGKSEVQLAPVEVAQTLASVRGLMRPLATNPSVTLTFDEVSPDLVIQTDESKLSQILRNLISNALKFTERGEVRVSVSYAADQISIFVTDTGIGIAPEDQETIFQEFSQVRSPIQRRVKGTGLGLPLSRKLTALLGGSLTLQSVVGSGSEFRLTLPTGTPARGGSIEAGAVPSEPSILIVDDEESSRYIARQLLRGTRHRIIEASGGVEGAERARFERPALIMLDLIMPDRSGFEVLEELKSDPATRDIPVVIHTSKRLSQNELDRISLHPAAVLPKTGDDRSRAFDFIRRVLGEPNLFLAEPGPTVRREKRV
jgi:signal transduction histidine kinase